MTPCERAAKGYIDACTALSSHLKQCGVKGCGPHDSTLDCQKGFTLFRDRADAYSRLSQEVFHLTPPRGPGGTITINGEKHIVVTEHVTYEEIRGWAGMTGTPTMTFKRGPEENPDGILSPDGVVKVKDWMQFNVIHTGNA
jgi:hypothetical protein